MTDILAQFMEPKDPHVVPASQPVEEVTEQERRAQEARDYLASLPQRKPATPEEIEAERQATLATIPMANGRPIPESGTLTQQQMENNPSNYKPAIEGFIEAQRPAVQQEEPIVVTAATFAQPAKPTSKDERQMWLCVQSDGIRTMDNKGQVHPAFQSDAHLADRMVRCPVCDSASVRKVMEGEDLSVSEKAAQWTRDRTKVMGLNPVLRS